MPIISCIGFQLDSERTFPINLQELHIGFFCWIGNNRSRKGKWRSAGRTVVVILQEGLFPVHSACDSILDYIFVNQVAMESSSILCQGPFYRNSKSRLNGLLPSYHVRPASLVSSPCNSIGKIPYHVDSIHPLSLLWILSVGQLQNMLVSQSARILVHGNWVQSLCSI